MTYSPDLTHLHLSSSYTSEPAIEQTSFDNISEGYAYFNVQISSLARDALPDTEHEEQISVKEKTAVQLTVYDACSCAAQFSPPS